MTLEEDLQWWLELAPTLNWTFAKTMPDAPHSYVVRGRTLDEERFMRAVKVIRTFGEPGKFYSATNIYLTDNETKTKWWTMGDTLEGTIIINKAATDDGHVYGKQDAPATASDHRSIYDELAGIYDTRYDADHCPECPTENTTVQKLIIQHFRSTAPRVLDVGCGTGLLLDMKITHPELFVGVDPSQAMLNELIRKFPRVKSVVPDRGEDVLDAYRDNQFELVTSLFGSPSYMPGWSMQKMADKASRLAIFMHYKEGYFPDYYDRTSPERIPPATADESREAAAAIPGANSWIFNNMQITVVEK